MSRYTTVVADHSFEDLSVVREGLGDLSDVEVLADDDARAREQLAAADALITGTRPVDEETVAALSACRVIARSGIGVDNIAVDAAADRGIPVVNVPDYCIEEVATHAVAMLLALARRLKPYDAAVAAGEWRSDRVATIERRFSSQTVGVVGYGTLGSAVGERIAALGADVLAADPFLEPGDVGDEATLVPLDDLLPRADFVTVHTPLTEGTRGLFDASAFRRMKDTAYLVNVARGPIVDEAALCSALDDGAIAGAGIDVFEREPPPAESQLRGHPNVIATPHVAWYSEEADDERRRSVVEAVRAALRGERPPNVVNGVDG